MKPTLEEVILVDKADRPIGRMEKMQAHQEGLLHRAFSVFLFNKSGDILMQQRADHKYHSGGLWSNTCCSHPRPGESLKAAAKRRLMEEMGIFCPMHKIGHITYYAALDNDLYEHEYDHILAGLYSGNPRPDSNEVKHWAYKSPEELKSALITHPGMFSEWFKIAFPIYLKHWNDVKPYLNNSLTGIHTNENLPTDKKNHGASRPGNHLEVLF